MVSFGEAVAIQVGRKGEVSLGFSVWYRGCRDGGDSSAFFGSDVDERVEAEEGGTWVCMVSGRGELVVVGCGWGMGGRGGIVVRVGGTGGSVGLCGAEGGLIWRVGCREGGTRVSGGAVEDGEERGGGRVVEEGIDGAGSVGASGSVKAVVGVVWRRGRVA